MSKNGDGNGFFPLWWHALKNRLHRSGLELAPYRRLAMQLHHDLPRSESPRSVLLITPSTSVLCAHGSADLAMILADELRRPVLLIDACPREPKVTRMLDCMDRFGFSDFLSNPQIPFDDLVLTTNHQNVSFLPAGTQAGPSLQTPPDNISALLKAAESRYDFVLLSGGPVLDNSTALALAPCVGCVLLLVIENETMVQDLDDAQDALGFCKARKVGLVFTTPVRRERWFV